MSHSFFCFDAFLRKLHSRRAIDDADVAAIHTLPFKERSVASSTYIVREGALPKRCGIICDGYAYRQKLTADGDRQIVMILLPGDIIDVQNLFLTESDHDIQALTALSMIDVPIEAVADVARQRPNVVRALWADSLVESSIAREWMLNVGQRSAKARIAHLLCEFRTRLGMIDEDAKGEYDLPMTQEQLGDALGLTPVHVNRMLQALERDGLIKRRQRRLSIVDWQGLKTLAQFNPRYLHLQEGATNG